LFARKESCTLAEYVYGRASCWFWHRPNVLCRNTMLRHAAVFAGSALRGGSRIASEARQLQQIRYLNVHEYQVRSSHPSSLQIASLLNVPH